MSTTEPGLVLSTNNSKIEFGAKLGQKFELGESRLGDGLVLGIKTGAEHEERKSRSCGSFGHKLTRKLQLNHKSIFLSQLLSLQKQ